MKADIETVTKKRDLRDAAISVWMSLISRQSSAPRMLSSHPSLPALRRLTGLGSELLFRLHLWCFVIVVSGNRTPQYQGLTNYLET